MHSNLQRSAVTPLVLTQCFPPRQSLRGRLKAPAIPANLTRLVYDDNVCMQLNQFPCPFHPHLTSQFLIQLKRN
jgi:hypothetical protein